MYSNRGRECEKHRDCKRGVYKERKAYRMNSVKVGLIFWKNNLSLKFFFRKELFLQKNFIFNKSFIFNLFSHIDKSM